MGSGSPKAAPFEFTSIEGSPTPLLAPLTAQLGGVTYEFKSWSDGGAREHTLIPPVAGDYVAIYPATSSSGGGGGGGAGGAGDGGKVTAPPRIPNAVLGRRPAKKTRATTARFRFSSTVPGSTFKCKLDRGSWKSCRSPRTYKGLKPGAHTFQLRATGSDGAVDPTPAEFHWKILPRPRP